MLRDWSTSLIIYPPHARSAERVVGLSHGTIYDALRLAEQMGFYTGWLLADAAPAHLVDVAPERPQWALLAELFAERRVAFTEGPVGGSLIFVAANQGDGPPPQDRDLPTWAASIQRPWVEVIDNEMVYWGGLEDQHIDRLLIDYLEQMPILPDGPSELTPLAAVAMRRGATDHGWTRNGALAQGRGRLRVDLWGGIHAECVLPHANLPRPSQVEIGLRLLLNGGCWQAQELTGACPLDDRRGRSVGVARG